MAIKQLTVKSECVVVSTSLAGVAVGVSAMKSGNRYRIALTGTNSRPLLIEGIEASFGAVADDGCITALVKLVSAVKPMRSAVTPVLIVTKW